MTSQSCGASWCQNQPKNPYFRPEMAGNGASGKPEAQGNTRTALYTTVAGSVCVDFTFVGLGCVIFFLVSSVCVNLLSPGHDCAQIFNPWSFCMGFHCVSVGVSSCLLAMVHRAYSSGMSTIFLLCFILKKVFSVQVVLP